jgi:ATP-dependent Lhr-like helicase
MTNVPEAFRAAAQSGASQSFGLLHPKVQRWIWQQGWEELRDIQERSIPTLLTTERDLIIAAGTASGKTEAAFLPIASRIASAAPKPGSGFNALYISPLRALINDQFRRMEGLCEELEIPVVKWHGDVSESHKAKARRKPQGIVLITPESLEALLVRYGSECRRLFGAVQHAVVDELHAFLDVPRGRQLQSLLHRIEVVAGRRIARVGLSATLADIAQAARFLRPLDSEAVEILKSEYGGQQVMLQIRGYIDPDHTGDDSDVSAAQAAIVQHVYETLRGTRGLIFAGSRQNVERLTADLSDLSEKSAVPNEFFAHHGSLSREHREEAEARMRDETRPASIVCTTTLELGIDIGHIDAIAQYGAGHSVASMRQRLGRSGRRAGKPAVMRIYVRETAFAPNIHPLDALRPDLVQAVAMVNLMQRHWLEPAQEGALHLSTLMHQLMALITQFGGLRASQAYQMLVKSGVFPNIDTDLFADVLRHMGKPDVGLIEQAADGTLLLGRVGEMIAENYRFFAVFHVPEEYSVVHGSKHLGSLPLEYPHRIGDLIIFAGRRWRVEAIDDQRHEISVIPAKGGRPPRFGGAGLGPSAGIVEEMRRVYQDFKIPPFIDRGAQQLLTEARQSFAKYGLVGSDILEHGAEILLFPWAGGPAQLALTLCLRDFGLMAEPNGFAIVIDDAGRGDVVKALQGIAANPAPDPAYLAASFSSKTIDKYDMYLSEELQAANFASRALETEAVPAIAASILHRAGLAGGRSAQVLGPAATDEPPA